MYDENWRGAVQSPSAASAPVRASTRNRRESKSSKRAIQMEVDNRDLPLGAADSNCRQLEIASRLVPVDNQIGADTRPWTGTCGVSVIGQEPYLLSATSLLDDPAECRCLDNPQIQSLLHKGISPMALGGPWAVLSGKVIFDQDPPRYRPLATGEGALIFGVLDQPYTGSEDLCPFDLIAWSPRSGLIGTRLGAAFALGEEQIGNSGLGTTGLPVPVHRVPLGWLEANRRGIVIADWEKAAYALRGLLLAAEDESHRRELLQRLRLAAPVITINQRRVAA